MFFSLYLSRPIKKLRYAAERLAKGDFNIRTENVDDRKHSLNAASYKGEIQSLTASFNYMAEASFFTGGEYRALNLKNF